MDFAHILPGFMLTYRGGDNYQKAAKRGRYYKRLR
jgi:hypothetical protein